jgi:hypothetical protein
MRTVGAIAFVGVLAACSKNGVVTADEASSPSNPPAVASVTPPEQTPVEKVLARHQAEGESSPEPVQPPGTLAQALAGIAQIQGIVRRRQTTHVDIDTAACEARMASDAERWKAAERLVGTERLKRRTRYADQAPNLGLTVDSVVWRCVGCSSPDDDEPVPHECPMALVALGDLATEVKADK